MNKPASNTLAPISDQDILNESGRKWNQWHSELNSKQFDALSLEEMAEKLRSDYSLDDDCAKAVALNYCQHIGRCAPSKTHGFQVEIKKTFNYPVAEVFNRTVEWLENENRAELQDHLHRKRLRCNWLSDNSKVGVTFNDKGGQKTQVVVKHNDLESATDVDIMRNFWKEQMTHMIESL
ncbi:MAG: hypothetical protein Salg2KO_13560 [Salibacteraceae bacterium]